MTTQQLFENYANELKANGFDIYVSANKPNPTYAFIVKDDKIGYMQIADFGGISFSTVHKPCKQCGTGFGISNDDNTNSRIDKGFFEPTIEDAERSFIFAPKWATANQCAAVKKYANWDEYAKRETILSYRLF